MIRCVLLFMLGIVKGEFCVLEVPEVMREIVRREIPLELLWSCYEEGDLMCGRCESCMRFKRALIPLEKDCGNLFQDPSL